MHPTECPICGGDLCVDVEYMLDTYGPAYEWMPWKTWSFYCTGDCEEAGKWASLLAKRKK